MTSHPVNIVNVLNPITLHNLTIFPVTLTKPTGPDYIASAVAIEQHGLRVTETGEEGSVPNLLVENPSNHCVLLLDGEELRGAKQNRIINTTLLLAPRSKTVIDVSCTESGRWSYNSPEFSHSKSVMPAKLRRKKTRSVSQSLELVKEFHSDQGEVWDEVQELHMKVGSHSPTSAMSDAYEKMRMDLDGAVNEMPSLENQCGLIAFINHKPAGLDLLSRPGVYVKLHPQLIKSYAMEALSNRKPEKCDETSAASDPDVISAKAFLEQCAAIKGKSYDSVALGTDWRFLQEPIVGSGLEHEDTWIHMAYFMDEVEDANGGGSSRHGRMARMSRRSGYRREGGDDVVY